MYIKGYTEIWEALEHLCPVKVHFGQCHTNRTLSVSLYYSSSLLTLDII